MNGMMPAACDGVIAVTAMSQGDGSIDVNQGIPSWTNFLNVDTTNPNSFTEYKYNFTVAAPGMYDSATVQYGTIVQCCSAVQHSTVYQNVSVLLCRCEHLEHVLPAEKRVLLSIRYKPSYASRIGHGGAVFFWRAVQVARQRN